jgi:hypothetical protein
MTELTAGAASSARALESAREQNIPLPDHLGVAVAERRQLLAVGTDRDRELTGRLVLRCGPFRIGCSTCGLVCLPTIVCCCSCLQNCRRCGIGGQPTPPE